MKTILATITKLIDKYNLRPSKTQWVRFGISLALAILLWGWVTQLQDPYQTREIANVEIQMGELPESLQVVSTLPDARVVLRGAESRLQPVRSSDIEVQIDTSGITGPGTFRVPVMIDVPNVSDRSVEPKEVTIQVDERISDIFPMHITYTDSTDRTRTVGDIVPEVTQVTVSGPKSAVDRVTDVILPVTVDNQTQSYDATYVPYAVDSEGQRVSEVTILPESIMTHVEVQTRGKAVSVIPAVTGVPAEGYSVQQRRALPDTIVVDGPEELLNDLLFVNTEPVDVTDATQSISTRVALADLPEGVTVLEPASGTVEVRVAIEDTSSSSQTLNDLPIESIGLGGGLSATIEPETVDIQVSASIDILQGMTPEDISILVDLSGLGPGTHRVSPVVTVPQGASWASTETEFITITIEEGTGATPESSTPASTPASDGGG